RALGALPPPDRDAYEALVTGDTPLERDMLTVTTEDVERSEWRLVPLTGAILLVALGSPVAAALPLVVGFLAICASPALGGTGAAGRRAARHRRTRRTCGVGPLGATCRATSGACAPRRRRGDRRGERAARQPPNWLAGAALVAIRHRGGGRARAARIGGRRWVRAADPCGGRVAGRPARRGSGGAARLARLLGFAARRPARARYPQPRRLT